MDNNNIMREIKDTELSKTQTSLRWSHKQIWFAVLGFWFLALSLGSIFTSIQRFPNDLFVANWLPWVIVLVFAVGWFAMHWIELALLKKQVRMALLLFVVLPIGSLFVSAYFHFFINNEVIQHFGTTSPILFFSGYCLRYSIFRKESVLPLRDLISRRSS